MLSNYLGEFLALATIHFLAVVAPGPDFAVTIRQSVRFGRLVGICTALGIGAGISVHVLYTLLGVGALMHTTPWLLTVAKVVGGAYILYLGVSLLRSKPKSVLEGDKAADEPVVEQTLLKAFTTGFPDQRDQPQGHAVFPGDLHHHHQRHDTAEDPGALRRLDVFCECAVVCHRRAVLFQRPGALAVHAHGALVRTHHGGDSDPVRRAPDSVDVKPAPMQKARSV